MPILFCSQTDYLQKNPSHSENKKTENIATKTENIATKTEYTATKTEKPENIPFLISKND